MQTSQRRALMFALKFSDQLILGCAFFLAIAAVSDTIDTFRLYQFFFLRIRTVNFALYLVFAWCWYGIFWSLGLYRARRFHTWLTDLKDVVNATFLGTFILLIFSILVSISVVTPFFLFLFWIYTTVATLTSRLLLRSLLDHLRRRGLSVQQLLIIGTNYRAVRFAQKIDSRLELGCRVIGFVDDHWAGTAKFLESGYPLVANLADFNKFLKKTSWMRWLSICPSIPTIARLRTLSGTAWSRVLWFDFSPTVSISCAT